VISDEFAGITSLPYLGKPSWGRRTWQRLSRRRS